MDRISGANYVLGAGGQRLFQDRNQAAGIFGTFFNALWCNGVQEELMAILAAADITPVAATFNQVLTSLGVLFGGGGTIAENGWQKLAGGLILQWGTLTLPTGNGDNVIFPIAFPNRCWGAIACEGAALGWGAGPYPTLYGTSASTTPKTSIFVSCVRFTAAGVPSFQGNTATYIAVGN